MVLTFKVIKKVVSLQLYIYVMPCPILLFLYAKIISYLVLKVNIYSTQCTVHTNIVVNL